jgi:hypothetical protein
MLRLLWLSRSLMQLPAASSRRQCVQQCLPRRGACF